MNSYFAASFLPQYSPESHYSANGYGSSTASNYGLYSSRFSDHLGGYHQAAAAAAASASSQAAVGGYGGPGGSGGAGGSSGLHHSPVPGVTGLVSESCASAYGPYHAAQKAASLGLQQSHHAHLGTASSSPYGGAGRGMSPVHHHHHQHQQHPHLGSPNDLAVATSGYPITPAHAHTGHLTPVHEKYGNNNNNNNSISTNGGVITSNTHSMNKTGSPSSSSPSPYGHHHGGLQQQQQHNTNGVGSASNGASPFSNSNVGTATTNSLNSHGLGDSESPPLMGSSNNHHNNGNISNTTSNNNNIHSQQHWPKHASTPSPTRSQHSPFGSPGEPNNLSTCSLSPKEAGDDQTIQRQQQQQQQQQQHHQHQLQQQHSQSSGSSPEQAAPFYPWMGIV
ncbi:hypothetical protein EGW08_003778, partial [Elysia chlorotica]